MSSFWDRRAQEDAFFFVDNRLEYGDPDLERFWADGEGDLETLLGRLGVSIDPGDAVLEVGCGVGRLTRVLAARASSIRALDVSEQMLALATEHNPDLANVEWILGDGATLGQIESGSVDACVSHVVFQHIPDPTVTLGYVREMGRVLRPDGWSAFQVSNNPGVHRPRHALATARDGARAMLGRAPRGQRDKHWLGSAVELEALRDSVARGSMEIEQLIGAGTQFCCVLTRRIGEPRP
jgi:SAM-dependent methyltransferase